MNVSNNGGMFVRVDPVSAELKFYSHLIFIVIISGLISLLGIVTNIINIVVFVRQGFKDSINISLLCLAIADLSCVTSLLWTGLSASPLVALSLLPFNGFDVSYMTGAWPHVCFNRITSFITAYITFERCLCVTMPLKVKNTFTRTTTIIVNLAIFVFMMSLFCPFYFVNKLDWVFSDMKNRSLLTLLQSGDRVLVETITFPIHSVALSVLCLVTVIVCTVILVASLNRKTKWRQRAVSTTATKSETAAMKETKVVKMVILISAIFLVCYFPPTAIFLIMSYDPDFSFTGSLGNLFIFLWCFSMLLESINSSVNIFVYFNMSTKFRTQFSEVFSVCFSLQSARYRWRVDFTNTTMNNSNE